MESYKFFDDSESNVNEHFSKIFKQKDKSIDEFDFSSMFELAHKEADEAASQDSPKFEFSSNMLDIDIVELENISHWTEFLLHESNKDEISTYSEFDIGWKDDSGSGQ
jgi:hypothetical protein